MYSFNKNKKKNKIKYNLSGFLFMLSHRGAPEGPNHLNPKSVGNLSLGNWVTAEQGTRREERTLSSVSSSDKLRLQSVGKFSRGAP